MNDERDLLFLIVGVDDRRTTDDADFDDALLLENHVVGLLGAVVEGEANAEFKKAIGDTAVIGAGAKRGGDHDTVADDFATDWRVVDG